MEVGCKINASDKTGETGSRSSGQSGRCKLKLYSMLSKNGQMNRVPNWICISKAIELKTPDVYKLHFTLIKVWHYEFYNLNCFLWRPFSLFIASLNPISENCLRAAFIEAFCCFDESFHLRTIPLLARHMTPINENDRKCPIGTAAGQPCSFRRQSLSIESHFYLNNSYWTQHYLLQI